MQAHKDLYESMTALIAAESPDHYVIRHVRRRSNVAVLAPHGGKIEPGTTEIAEAIAENDYDFYTFEGRMHRDNFSTLHVASTNYDEEKCTALVKECNYVIAVHGLADRSGDEKDNLTICLGGTDTVLRDAIKCELVSSGFKIQQESGKEGLSLQNICNRGKANQGVQLEIRNALRRALVPPHTNKCGPDFPAFVKAIRDAITSVTQRQE